MFNNTVRSVIVISLFGVTLLTGCSGQCDYPDDRARDGSRCGDRAASVRPGGRNPDTDWIFWVLGIGAVGWLLLSSSGKSSPPTRMDSVASNTGRQSATSTTSRPPPPPTGAINRPLPRTAKDLPGKPPSRSQEIPFEGKARNVLRAFFDVEVESMFEPAFQGVCKQVEENGGNSFDAATHYMLTQIGSFEGIPGANIDSYVDIHTRNIMGIVDRLTIEPESMPHALNLLRTMRNLKPI
jgi:hypothetical protein